MSLACGSLDSDTPIVYRRRGRKQDNGLPPSRVRDLQRTFRARRTAHRQALEQRIAELEQENSYFRQLLYLPQSSRPLLGRGPTGLEKPQIVHENPRLCAFGQNPLAAYESAQIEGGTGYWGMSVAN